MPTVSEQLRQAREHQALTVHQVAEVTKIKTDHVRALDEGNYETFSAPVYIRGFVRSYASLLKLDVPTIMSMLEQELTETTSLSEPPALTPKSKTVLDILMYQLSKVKWRVVLPLLGVTCLVLLGWWGVESWRKARNSDPLTRLSPGLYKPSQDQSAETLPFPQ